MMKTRMIEAKRATGRVVRRWTRGVLVPIVALTGCDVTNPGNILDEDLNSEVAFPALVNGMASDFGVGLNGATRNTAVLFGELWESTSGFPNAGIGDVPLDRPELANWTNPMHRARWVAEDGLRRMKDVLGSSGPLVAEALVWAGFSNRLLGNTHCRAVFDAGPPQPRQAFFERAEQHFSEAIQVATSAAAADLLLAAHGGRAQVRLVLGNLSGALDDASRVPTDYVFEQIYNDVAQGSRQTNILWHETHPRRNISVVFTWFRDYYLETGDPRVPSADPGRPAADGQSPLISIEKYPDGTANVPLIKGAEMRLIEAEGLILGGQWEEGLAIMNDLRANVPGADLAPWEATDGGEAFEALIKERAIVLWLEARQGDEHYRLNQLTEIFPNGYTPADGPLIPQMAANAGAGGLPASHQLLSALKVENRSTCFPFSEQMFNTNSQLTGS